MGYLKIDELGNKLWYNNEGRLHREDGLAIELLFWSKEWWIDGKCHREDGPAVEYYDGRKEWYYNGKFIGSSSYGFTQKEFEKHIRSLKIKEYW